jgi:ribosomal protein S18 acetylase RimI-like enzyme
MISVFNKYIHGYVVTPVLIALIRGDIFATLSDGCSIIDLEKKQPLNRGNLKVAFRIFQSLGWLECTDGTTYRLSSSMPDIAFVPVGINEIYNISLNHLLDNDEATLEEIIKLFRLEKWETTILDITEKDDITHVFLQSAFILPLIYLLRLKGCIIQDKIQLEGVSQLNHTFITTLFRETKLAEISGTEITLNEIGSFLADNVQKAGVALSYHQLLGNIDELLFGDASSVFSGGEIETHINRALNVKGSGDQHNLFFRDLTEAIKKICSGGDSTPVKIVDMGCGDGSLLRKTYEALRQQEQPPAAVSLIGVDINTEALKVAGKMLHDIPHQLIQGDIARPDVFMKQLDSGGYKKADMLHIRTFLDHNCPVSAHLNGILEANDPENTAMGIFVDDAGDEIPPNRILLNYVQHFKRWHDVVGSKGLITLEVYSLEPFMVHKYLDETENLHFDALHGFSKQYLLSAPDYILTAAEAGLIAQAAGFKKYPRLLPYTRISLQRFLSKSYTIRHPRMQDLDALIEIETATLPAELQAGKEQIEKRVANNPRGIYLLEEKGVLAGVLYSQRIKQEADLYEMNYENLESFHDASGKFVQLISLNIHPSYQGSGLANELLTFGLLHNFLKSNVKRIVGITRCAMYSPAKGIYNDYIGLKNRLGYYADPILNMHYEEGAQIIGTIPGYRVADTRNAGNGVHIKYDYKDWIAGKES